MQVKNVWLFLKKKSALRDLSPAFLTELTLSKIHPDITNSKSIDKSITHLRNSVMKLSKYLAAFDAKF